MSRKGASRMNSLNSCNNNNDTSVTNHNTTSDSGNSSEDGDGQVTVLCEETSALFSDVLQERCAGADGKYTISNNKVQLVWRHLEYSVETYDWKFPSVQLFTRSEKRILNNISGRIESGSLTAVIGPSGAGKSSLLEILAGRREKGVKGSIMIHYDSRKHAIKTKIAFMCQQDLFCGNLTVRETLMYASKLKNYSSHSKMLKRFKSQISHNPEDGIAITPMQMHNEVKNYHANLVADILEELFLSPCAHVYVANCSGGQQKRLSIACELVSRPDILLLDEPTSGLDSFSAFQCVQLLKKLAHSKSLAVILSIHQPSSQTLSLFDKLYVISNDGRCIFNHSTTSLLSFLKERGFECPMFYNPADFITEIASGDHGQECINDLAILEEKNHEAGVRVGENEIKLNRVVEIMMRKPLPLVSHTWTLLKRSSLVTWRDPMLASLSLFQHVFVALIMGVIFSTSSGGLDGCYKPQHVNPAHFSLDTLKDFQREEIYTQQNVGFLFFSLIFLFLASMMATVLTFPLEMGVFVKERANRWYSCASYYLARTIADTPYRIIFPLIYSLIIYRMTGQIDDGHRFAGFSLLYVLVAFVAQAKGLLIGSLYANDVSSAVFVAPLSCIPVVLFAGFFVKLQGLPGYLSALPVISYFKYAFEASIILIYGFERCSLSSFVAASNNFTHNPFYDLHTAMANANFSLTELTPQLEFYLASNGVSDGNIDKLLHTLEAAENATQSMFGGSSNSSHNDHNQGNFTSSSYIMSHFEVSDGDLVSCILSLVLFFFIFRAIAYLVLYFKSTPKK